MHAKRAHVRRRKAQPEVKRQEKRSDTEALRRRQRLHAARERGCAMAALTNRALEEAACVLGPRAPTLKRIPRSVTHQQRLKRHHRLKAEYAEAVQSFAAVLPCVAARLARERGDAVVALVQLGAEKLKQALKMIRATERGPHEGINGNRRRNKNGGMRPHEERNGNRWGNRNGGMRPHALHAGLLFDFDSKWHAGAEVPVHTGFMPGHSPILDVQQQEG